MMEYPAKRSNSQFSRPTLCMRIRGKEGYIETESHSRPIRPISFQQPFQDASELDPYVLEAVRNMIQQAIDLEVQEFLDIS